MRFLDEKARLFGIVNIIDLALIILGLIFIVFIIIFMQFYRYPKPMIYNIAPNVVVAELQENIHVFGSNFSKNTSIYLGDKKVGSVKFVDTRNIEFKVPTDLPAGNYDLKAVNRHNSIVLTNALIVKPGVIKKWLKVRVKFSSLPLELYGNLKKGALAKNASSKVIAKIAKIESKKPSKIMVFFGSYKMFDQTTRMDVVALCEILVTKRDGDYYYENQIVKLNEPILFSSDLFDIKGLIIGVQGR